MEEFVTRGLAKILKKYKLKGLKITMVNKPHKLYDALFLEKKNEIIIYLGNNDTDGNFDSLIHELAHAILFHQKKKFNNHTPAFYALMGRLVNDYFTK